LEGVYIRHLVNQLLANSVGLIYYHLSDFTPNPATPKPVNYKRKNVEAWK